MRAAAHGPGGRGEGQDAGLPGTLAAIAAVGSFTHIRDLAAAHRQAGWMAWAVAVCIDLLCVMAAPIRLHDLPHTRASLLKQLGVPPRDAMEILGHSRISVTMEIYTHADGEAHRAALDKLGNLFDDNEEEW